MLTTEKVSNIHRLYSDDIWQYHAGGAARRHFRSREGAYSFKDIGPELENGQAFQVIIPRHSWFAAEVIGQQYVLVGCTVAPGFDFSDFELAKRSNLKAQYPSLSELITRFTGNSE